MLNLTPSRSRATLHPTLYARVIGHVVRFLADDRPLHAPPISSLWSLQIFNRFGA
jgi:hypothetical protein